MTWREYHEFTKHTAEKLRRTAYGLDWANMPDPFRHYEGVPVLDLTADPPPPRVPALDVLQGRTGVPSARSGPEFLSQLLYYAAAISASKLVPSTGYRYALRVNPSSGNLHPTEFHFWTRGLADWPDGLYHYRPSSHMAEQRAAGNFAPGVFPSEGPVVFVLTSIAWREAWKYRDRAYRYCLLDMGHAWQSLELAARALGLDCLATARFDDDAVARQLRLAQDEWPLLLLTLQPAAQHPDAIPRGASRQEALVWHAGEANQLSAVVTAYPRIEAVHQATCAAVARQPAEDAGSGDANLPALLPLPAPCSTAREFGDAVRGRRSALDFRGGAEEMQLDQLSAMLQAACQPLAADFADAAAPYIELYLYVHRVEGLAPGVYLYAPREHGLEMIRAGDQRVAAAGLSLGQDLAGNACVAFSMLADIERAAAAHGDRGYRYVHFEAGAIGQRLYLAAEALGLAATGIGAFFDDQVHGYLFPAGAAGRPSVVYHFSIGYPVPDARVVATYREDPEE